MGTLDCFHVNLLNAGHSELKADILYIAGKFVDQVIMVKDLCVLLNAMKPASIHENLLAMTDGRNA